MENNNKMDKMDPLDNMNISSFDWKLLHHNFLSNPKPMYRNMCSITTEEPKHRQLNKMTSKLQTQKCNNQNKLSFVYIKQIVPNQSTQFNAMPSKNDSSTR